MTATREIPLPGIDPLTRPFWEGTKQHRLVMQRCPSCRRLHWLPSPSCQTCGNPELLWEQLKGVGTVYTFTIVHKVVRNTAFAKMTPYLIAVVELDEGPRMIADIQAESPDLVKIGSRVEVTFDDITPEISLPRFRLV
ncbi:MAG: Zn-ribbon domain-containing OB-fold protein [Nitrososphaerota archaeon]|jgi:uncharacterized OB-fold protein|nr:Zn-ribbon domain-containing OB-fold protein [Nitrososphaerota archaeon]MDG6966336.1 Zn-ribbon domain-containing OB-fold protein [Nitrososphaerota archaeon]MDG6977771.1 Zn-ribbon domain-containing OB-fold protein [Nitrososphaerota archaeon]